MSLTTLQYNYTNNNIPGAYYGLLPELPRIDLAVPNGTIDLVFNTTDDQDLSSERRSQWDYLYTIYFNRPDSMSVYPSPSGYQFNETIYFGHAFAGGNNITFGAGQGPMYINESTYIFSPGDSLVPQLIELEEDGSTPTGRRFFAQNITLVQNDTVPITTTLGASENPLYSTQSYTVVSTSSRSPPASTYPWTAEAAVSSAIATSNSSSISGGGMPSQTSAPANTGSRSSKRSMLQIGTALLLISAAVAVL